MNINYWIIFTLSRDFILLSKFLEILAFLATQWGGAEEMFGGAIAAAIHNKVLVSSFFDVAPPMATVVVVVVFVPLPPSISCE
jgi:hypothetical protein